MKLLIAGAGGHGRVVADAALCSGVFSQVAFLDDAYPGLVLSEGWPVVGKLDSMNELRATYRNFVAAFGNASLLLSVLESALRSGFDCPIVTHSSAVISKHVVMGMGTVVVAGAVINVGSKIGMGCIINTGATVDHDCKLANGVHVGPGSHLAGGVTLGERTWFGIGAVAKQGVRVGDDAVIGAGAVVVADVPDRITVVGNPAKPMERV